MQQPPKDDKQRSSTKHPDQNEYPLQEVYQHEGGYRFVIGNEKGKQFVAEWHPSGSHTIHHPDGSVTSWTVGDHKVHHKGGATLSVDENNDVKVGGHNKVAIQGGGHMEVAGDMNLVVGGAGHLIALSGMGASVKGNGYMGVDGQLAINAKGGIKIVGNIELEGNLTMQGNINITGNIDQKGEHKDNKGGHVGGSPSQNVPLPNINKSSPLVS